MSSERNDNKFGRIDGVPEGEPCFVLRAKDKATRQTLTRYWQVCRLLGSSQEHLDAIDAQRRRIDAWQREHPDRMKVPD